MTNRASIELLRRMTVYDIAREGPTASVMVRSGLLLEIIDLALASGIEAATAGETSTQIEGSTEGESPTAESGDAQPSQPPSGSNQ